MTTKRARSNQPAVDTTIADDIAASAPAVKVVSKPELVANLRSTWRKSAEHKAAQVKRFVSALAAVVLAQVLSDVAAGKTPFTTVHDLRSAWFYLLPVVLVAWRQLHPALTATQVDSAPGATIVPAEVDPVDPAIGVGKDDPATGYGVVEVLLIVVLVLVILAVAGVIR